MQVLIMDGQGGKIGRALTESVKKYDETIHVIAIGTNSMATAAMIKGGADEAATGENPVVVCAPKVDVIMGPIGILVADALLGETALGKVLIHRLQVLGECEGVQVPLEKCSGVLDE